MKKKLLSACALSLFALALISWGATGHRTIGRIAENHLTPEAKAAVRDLLGNETLADASTWADEVRPTPEYRQTAPWHYINLPLGLSYEDFQAKVKGMTDPNVYSALLNCESDLASSTTTRDQKIVALKFIVHFVGDLHQPMHVSRSEDKGGNTIQLNYEGQGTNLHALWDSKLIEHQGLNDQQLAEKYDHISPAKIKEWQGDPLIKWIWESYQISSKLYAEVDQMTNHTVTDDYYQQHMPIIEERLQQAGIRLAGVLNGILSKPMVNAAATAAAAVATAPDTTALAHYCDKVYGGRHFDDSGMTLLNLGAEYPNQKMTIVIRGADSGKFPQAPETYYQGKQICVTGKQEMYRGKPEIVVTDPSQIQVQ